jgi:hypothetical protein
MNTKFDITRFYPCDEGMEYYESKASFKEAWNDCKRGDWMLWIAAKLEIDRKLIVKAAALCANTVRHLMKDKRSTDAIDACLRYAAGEIGKSELENYAAAAYSAYAAEYAAYAAEYADRAAYSAADSAYDSAYYAPEAARAAYAARDAADAAGAAASYSAYFDNSVAASAAAHASAARTANRLLTANICREQLTEAVMEKVRNI